MDSRLTAAGNTSTEVVFHEEALYQVYVPLPLPLLIFPTPMELALIIN